LAESADRASGGIWTSFCTSYWNDVGTIDRLNAASKEVERYSARTKSEMKN
jgi:NDP-sugar pyrophosphorylase family protein